MEAYLTIKEIAQHLKLRPQTIRRWVQMNEIPYCRIRKNIRFRIAEIDRWVDAGGIASNSEDTTGELFTENEKGTEGMAE